MTMLAHARSPYVPQRQGTVASVSLGPPHLAMIRRFLKFVMGMLLGMAVVAAVVAIKTIAWFPPYLH